ncbi:MAG: glycosyltransferase family 1 protein [Verrucomicrobiaceae bacterium]|nr:glycosyltransferase family 1 protein [Verrucomicrobiaceae bacterium]
MNDFTNPSNCPGAANKKSMRFLLHAVGSHGDIIPIIELAKALRERGHDPLFLVHVIFEQLVRDAGIAVITYGALKDQEILRDADIVHEWRAHRVLAQVIADTTPVAYRALTEAVSAGPRPTAVIGNTVAFACHLLRETHAIPCVTIHYAPSVLRSNEAPARLSRYKISLPSAVFPIAWRALDRWFVDPLYAAPLNRQRAIIGLAPIKRVIHDWIHQADLVLGMFPELFTETPSDWPAGIQLTGFPLQQLQPLEQLTAAAEIFLTAGEAPIGFTAGTHTATAREFFDVSLAACRQLGRRGIFLTRFADQIPPLLPAEIAHFAYVPFPSLLPRLAAFVHHGGIGSTSQALLAGVPQLIRPTSFDQFDNSSRTCALGVAKEVLAHKYVPNTVATTLNALTQSATIRSNCINLSQRLMQSDGVYNACEAILNAPFCHDDSQHQFNLFELPKSQLVYRD